MEKQKKTEPFGVRFRPQVLEMLRVKGLANTPQKALNFLEDFYVGQVAEENNRPENKARIVAERAGGGMEGNSEKNRTASPLQQEKVGAPRSFQELLQAVKMPGVDRVGLETEIREAKGLTPNQKDMLFAKLKNQ